MSLNCGHQQSCCSLPRWYMSMKSHSWMILRWENQITLRETCPFATLATTNTTWIDPCMNQGFWCEGLAAICLSQCMAYCVHYYMCQVCFVMILFYEMNCECIYYVECTLMWLGGNLNSYKLYKYYATSDWNILWNSLFETHMLHNTFKPFMDIFG
jgi:hypothetical protein